MEDNKYGDGEVRVDGRGVLGGHGGAHGTVRKELILNGMPVCHAWNNLIWGGKIAKMQ